MHICMCGCMYLYMRKTPSVDIVSIMCGHDIKLYFGFSRSRGNKIFHIFVLDIIGHQSLYLGLCNIRQQLIYGQSVVC